MIMVTMEEYWHIYWCELKISNRGKYLNFRKKVDIVKY